MATGGGMIAMIIGVVVAVIVVFNIAVPLIGTARDEAGDNLTAAEKTIAGMITLFLVLGLMFAAGRAFGIV